MNQKLPTTETSAADNHPLWPRLRDFQFDDPAAPLAFSKRLARENDWSARFAHRVIEEYRRFLFLTQVAGHPVTPSDEVDQVWHLHLVYTRSYWEDLCGSTLEQPLHHGPTRGGTRETAKFENWYARTLASYHHWFGVNPPADIWPPAGLRFGRAPTFRRVSTQDFLLVPRKKAARLTTVTAVLLLACAGLGFTGELSDGAIRTIVISIFVLVLLVIIIANRKGGGRSGGGCGTSCGSGCGGCGGD